MLSKFDAHRDAECGWVQAYEDAVRAANKDMRLCLGLYRDRAPNLLAVEGRDFRNLLEGLLIKHEHLAVRTIHKHSFLC